MSVYRRDIGVTTHGGFVIRRDADKLSAGAIAVFEAHASISSRPVLKPQLAGRG
jgi:hypothetical protein